MFPQHETAMIKMQAETMSIGELIMTISTTDDSKVLYTAMVNLEDVLYEQEGLAEKQDDFMRLGGPLAVVTTMLKQHYNMAVQEWGIVILTKAADKNPAMQGIAVEVGGVHAILQAMAMHPSSRSIQEAGLEALFTLCSSKSNAEILATKFNSVPLIVKAMEMFADDEDVVLLASQLLDRLSDVERSQQVMIDAQVVGALSTILQAHRQNKTILKYAGRTMIRLVVM